MNKRGQSEVITTVLIILLVLAAVFIVWTAVRGMVSKGTEGATNAASCIDVDFTLSNLACTTNGATVTGTLARGSDSAGAIQYKVVADGTAKSAINAPDALGTAALGGTSGVAVTAAASHTVAVAAVLNSGATTCNPIDTRTVTCS